MLINSSIVKIGLYRSRKSLIFLIVGSSLFGLFFTLIFPGMALDSAKNVADSWPDIMKNLFGNPVYAFTNIYGWMNLQIFHITYWLIYGVFGTVLATSIIAKEIEDRSLDILLTCPLSRAEIILSRIVSISILLVISILPLMMGCIIGTAYLGYEIYIKLFVFAYFEGFVLFLIFSSLTTLISVYVKGQISVLAMTWSIISLLFIMEKVITKMFPSTAIFSTINPFHYYNSDAIFIGQETKSVDLFILTLIFGLLIFATTLCFRKKDIVF
jgi:ABC-2 type transport system permease protein